MKIRILIFGYIFLLLLVGCSASEIDGEYSCTNLGENQAGAILEIANNKAKIVFNNNAGSAEFNLDKISKYVYYLWLTNPSTNLKEGFNITFSSDYSTIDFQKDAFDKDVQCSRNSR